MKLGNNINITVWVILSCFISICKYYWKVFTKNMTLKIIYLVWKHWITYKGWVKVYQQASSYTCCKWKWVNFKNMQQLLFHHYSLHHWNYNHRLSHLEIKDVQQFTTFSKTLKSNRPENFRSVRWERSTVHSWCFCNSHALFLGKNVLICWRA